MTVRGRDLSRYGGGEAISARSATKRVMTISAPELTREDRRGLLDAILLAVDPTDGLWEAVDSGLAEQLIPELPALRLEQDPIHRHKDVLAHTIAVTAKTRPELKIRLAALFHDIGKPATRRIDVDEGVTFRHHEAVGAKMTKKRLKEMGYDPDLTRDVAQLVRMSGRFKGYADGWSDSAVRRYARDAGHLLGDLNELIRCDCTTRNKAKAEGLQRLMDEFEARIVELARQDRMAAERPQLDGKAVMDHLGIGGGPLIGKALDHLLAIKRSEGVLPDDEIRARLDAWWAENKPDS